MHPQLHVRELIDPRAIPFLKGAAGFRPAATVTFGDTRQSKRELAREFDKAKRRAEDWEKRHASAEPILIGSFPSFSSLATKSFNLVGSLPPGQELRELQVVVEATVALNVGAGQIQAADYNVIAVAIIKKLRASLYGNNDALNLFPAEVRTIDFIADNRDPFQQDPNLRIGTALTTTTKPFKLKLKIPFCVRSLEVPEIVSPTSDQANLPGSKVDLDTQGDALATVGLASGASTIVVSDVKLYAVANQVPVLHAGPPHVWRVKQIAQSVDTEFGQGFDIFVGTEEAATALGAGARVLQFTIRRDGRQQPLNVDPVTLAQQFNESQFSVDALAALDITTGTIPFAGVATAAQPVPSASVGAQAGAAVVPLEWNDGRIRAGAWQWPFYTQSRQVVQNLIGGQSAVINLLYWQVRPIFECQGQVINMAAANGIPISSVDDLMTRGGNDGEVNKLFKGRFMRKRAAPSRAA